MSNHQILLIPSQLFLHYIVMMSFYLYIIETVCVHLLQDATTLLRVISTHKHHPVHFAKTHPHLLVEKMTFSPSEGMEHGTVSATGYVRGRPLTANGLIYLPALGHFQISQVTQVENELTLCRCECLDTQIDGPPDPHLLKGQQVTRQDHMVNVCVLCQSVTYDL